MNVLFALSNISFGRYTLTTLICAVKVLANVYLGKSIQVLTDIDKRSTLDFVIFIVGVVIAVVGILYVGWLARRALRDIKDRKADERLEREMREQEERGQESARGDVEIEVQVGQV
jgi:uncharacterized membrane protein YdjX (TVP38/TMEM64 family)